MSWNRSAEIEDQIFTERRIRFYGTGVAVAYAVSLAWRLVHGQWVILPDGRPRCIDFGWMWLSGRFAVSGNSAKIFDYSTFSAAQIALFGHDNCPFITPYVYPPTYLFMTYFLGFMPYLIAFAAWVLATLFLYGTAVYAIIPRRAVVIAAMSPFFVAVNADFGHNGYITAALVGFSLASLERRPWLSGIFLGLLTYKPHFGVLFPLALLASRNWRALASATVATVILGIGAAFAFGSAGWAAFLHTLVDRQSTLSPDFCSPTSPSFSFWFASLGGDERTGFMGRTPHRCRHRRADGLGRLGQAHPIFVKGSGSLHRIRDGAALHPLLRSLYSHHRRRLSRSRRHVTRISPRRANCDPHLLRRPLSCPGADRPRCQRRPLLARC